MLWVTNQRKSCTACTVRAIWANENIDWLPQPRIRKPGANRRQNPRRSLVRADAHFNQVAYPRSLQLLDMRPALSHTVEQSHGNGGAAGDERFPVSAAERRLKVMPAAGKRFAELRSS